MSSNTRTPVVVLVVALARAAGSQAQEWQYFFTNAVTQPYGLSIAANAFDPTKNEGRDVSDGHYIVDAFPGLDVGPYVTPTINWSAGEFAYLWVRFVDVPNSYKIQGVQLDLDGTPASVAYYVVDDMQGEYVQKRWEGAFGLNNVNFKQDPQILAAVTTIGIQNRSTAIQNWNLYDHTTRTALLGAVRYDSDGLRSLQYGPAGGPGAYPPLPPIPPAGPVFGQANWIPEPASLLLAATLAAAVRRRE